MKNEKEVLVKDAKIRMTLADPKERAKLTRTEIKKRDKLNAMKIAQTHIEIQNLTVKPEEAIKIADKFLKWLEK